MTYLTHNLERAIFDRLFDTEPSFLQNKRGNGQELQALSVIFLCLGLGFIIYGSHLWLVNKYTPEATAGITGILIIICALIIAISAYWISLYRQLKMKKMRRTLLEKFKSSLSSLDDELGGPIRENPKTAILLASLIGFALEERIF